MATNPTLLAMPLAENGQKNTIPETQAAAGNGLMSQSTGFPPETALPLGAGGKAPTREDFNGAFNLLSNIAFYAQKGWTFEYDATQDYFKGCIVIDPSDGLRYECLNDMVAGTVAPHEDTDNDYWKVFSTGGGVQVGFIMPYAGTGLQEGWLDCDGSAVSRTMYPDLFAAIGTTWGAGDGSTTFNLPRSEDLVFQGASATNPVGTYLSAGLPNIEGKYQITGGFQGQTPEYIDTDGAISPASSYSYYGSNSASAATLNGGFTFDASDSNPIYGNSDTVQSPAACVRFMIKAFDGPTPSSAGIDLTQYAQDLANKADRSLSNLNAAGEARLAHVVVDSYYDSTTGDWWRKYADGWLEQGGIKDTTGLAANNVSVSLLVPMSDSNYSIQANTVSGQAMTTESGIVNLNTTNGCAAALNRCSTTGFYINFAQQSLATGFGNVVWRVCGMGASV